MPEALDQVVVHHAHRLHEGVADGAAHEFEPPPSQVFAHGIRCRGIGRYVPHRLPGVLLRLVADESQVYLSKLPNSSCTTRNIFAFWTAASTLRRLRTI